MGDSFLLNQKAYSNSRMIAILLLNLVFGQLALSWGPPLPPSRGLRHSSKWVFCQGSWHQVKKSECPVVFEDPTFEEHDIFCEDEILSDVYPGVELWHWIGMSDTAPFTHCEHFSYMLCTACTPV